MRLQTLFLTLILLFPISTFAEATAGIPSGGIWFSKEPFFAGEEIVISTIVFNSTKSEVTGVLELIDKGTLISKKDISVSSGDNKIFNFPIIITEGKHSFSVRIAGGNLEEKNATSTTGIKISAGSYYSSKTDEVLKVVLKDTDGDGISDADDPDIDGDSLSNDQEKKLGTNSNNPDTDGDGILDGVDKRPLKIDTIPDAVKPITEEDAKKVADKVGSVIPKSVVDPVFSVATPVIGSIETFRVGQANNNNERINNQIDNIIEKVGTSKVLGTGNMATNSTSSINTSTGKPTGWSVFKNGVTTKEDFTKTPFGYVKLFFYLIYQFIVTNTWVFYILSVGIIFRILVGIKRLIFKKEE